ncbi:LacI family DNA-binding transcriptional regulator [Lacticaseibacillus camelliae]|uniref:LacI family DNA-binding transcriptional regulator n=1 Tax=Lacticaseibacillus camelliae TaxID=381742 RepID=UPI000704D938|nr:LacI family DNA-binding transcriptional regulator [Lacticaseibacillus camelliae]
MVAKIYDVAKAAGVSVGTVSRVFNGYTDISRATKKRVLKVAKELGYTPNVAARTLSSKSLKTIAFIMNDLVGSRYDGVSMQTIMGVYHYAETHEMQFVLYPTTTQQQRAKTFAQFCEERNINGAVVQGLHVDDPYVAQIAEAALPVVTIDLAIPGPRTGAVSIDNTAAEKAVTQLLLNRGRRHLLMVNGRQNAQVSVVREAGFKAALAGAGMTADTRRILYADYDMKLAGEQVAAALTADPAIDGIVCASDAMALGALNVLKARQLRVPADVALAGFDNTALAEFVDPALTTVEQHMDIMGYNAAELVNKLLQRDMPTAQRQIFSPYEVIERASTGGQAK